MTAPEPPPGIALAIEDLWKIYRLGRPPRRFRSPFRRDDDRRTTTDVDDDDGLPETDEDDRQPTPLATERVREIEALRGLSFEVPAGTGIGITGPVASGKSTLLKVIGRVTPPTRGRVMTVGRVAPHLGVAAGLTSPDRTGRENAYRLARFFGVPRVVVDRRLEAMFDLADLSAKVDVEAGRYSGSEYRRLGVSIALNLESDIVLIDDKLAVGDSVFQERVRWRLGQARSDGLTLVFASGDPAAFADYCDEILILDGGQVADRGSPDEILERAQKKGQTNQRRRSPDVLSPKDRNLLALILVEGRSCEEIAGAAGGTVDAVRVQSSRAVEAIASPTARLSTADRKELIEYLLGQLPVAERVAVEARLENDEAARAWVAATTVQLRRLVPEATRLPELTADNVLRPGPDRGTVALVRFITLARGEAAASQVVERASDLTDRRGRAMRWFDIARIAGFEREEAQGIIARVLDEQASRDAASGKRNVFNEHLAIVGVEVSDGDSVSTSIRADDEPTIRIRLETATPDIEIRCSVVLVGERGGSAVRIGQPHAVTTDAPGAYVVAVRLPPHLLAPDHHVGRVVVQTRKDGQKSVVQRRDILSLEVFSVDDTVDDADDELELVAPSMTKQEMIDLEWWIER